MDLLYLLYSLLRKKWVIITCSIAGVIAAYIFFMFRPKEYVSLAQYSTGFTMQQQVKIKQEENYNLYEIDIRFSNMSVAFASDKVLGMLAYKLLLHDLEDSKPFRQVKDAKKATTLFIPSNINKVKQILREKISNLELLTSYKPDEKMVMEMIDAFDYGSGSLMNKLSLDRVGRTDFINIFANSENPHLSAYMVNTAGTQLIRFFNEIYGFRTQTASGKLDSLVVVKKTIVDSLTKRLEKFKKDVGPNTGADKATAAMSVVQELYGKYQEETRTLNNLKAELAAVEEQLRALNTDNPTTTPTANNNKEVLRLKQENTDLEMSKNGKTDDEITKIQEKIDANTNKIIQLSPARGPDRSKDLEKKSNRRDELIGRKIEIQQQMIATQKNVDQFRNEKDKYEAMTNQGGGDVVIVEAMERDLDLAIKEYSRLKTGAETALDLDLNPQTNFKQTLIGMPADKPSPSRRMIVSGLAGFLMFFFSCLIILLLEFLDNSYKTPTIFLRTAKIKLLTSINRIDLKHKDLQFYLPQNGGEPVNESQKLFLENLRKLRFELENSGKKTILVTSTRAKEGKSLIIESLANSFSLAHKKVLIIDANFSNNTLSEKFGAKPSLEQFSVNGLPNAMDKILSAMGATTIPNTDIIGCNEGNYTPSEILPKNHLLESIDKIAANYDIILIEAASLNNHADAKELAKYADGIVAVFSASSAVAQSDKESIEYLKSTGTKLVGAVFNNVQKDNMDL